VTIDGYFLGCPIWAFSGWNGSLYGATARGEQRLEQYASVFNTVEGNGTFYGVPEPTTVERWRACTPESFRFCFKLPRRITHELELRSATRELQLFLQRMAPLGERLGPFMIQLPSRLGPAHLGELARFLRALPRAFRFALEVRHPGFFAPAAEHAGTAGDPRIAAAGRLAALLEECGVERVALDTRALRSGPADHPDVVAALHAKPDLPPVPGIGGRQPIARFISHPLPEFNEGGLELWAARLDGWIAEGRTPYFFVHCPNNVHSPATARRAHALLGTRRDVGTLPPFPGELRAEPERQLSLF
jgi:uncharacterized protein YecE (DUF72 family)